MPVLQVEHQIQVIIIINRIITDSLAAIILYGCLSIFREFDYPEVKMVQMNLFFSSVSNKLSRCISVVSHLYSRFPAHMFLRPDSWIYPRGHNIKSAIARF